MSGVNSVGWWGHCNDAQITVNILCPCETVEEKAQKQRL
jgi:hypothetical protein